jgi:hypothetical protein
MTVTYSPHRMNQIETIPEPGTCWLHQRQRDLPQETFVLGQDPGGSQAGGLTSVSSSTTDQAVTSRVGSSPAGGCPALGRDRALAGREESSTTEGVSCPPPG